MENKREQHLMLLGILKKYMPKLRMIPDLIDKLENQGLDKLLPSHLETLERLISKSWQKKQILREMEQIFPSSTSPAPKQVEQVEQVDTYTKSLLVERNEKRVPIGFKVPSKVENYTNRYTIKTNPSLSSPKTWDDKQWDNFWNN